MKKLICILLCIITGASLCACGSAKTSSDGDSVDVEYYVKTGGMPECEYGLGADIDHLSGELESAAKDNEESNFNVVEGDPSVLIESGDFAYYYLKDKKDKGISYIVNYGDAFGFAHGTVTVEIKKALEKFDVSERDAKSGELFFLPSVQQYTVIEKSFGKNTVMFVFTESALCATVIYSNENWTV